MPDFRWVREIGYSMHVVCPVMFHTWVHGCVRALYPHIGLC